MTTLDFGIAPCQGFPVRASIAACHGVRCCLPPPQTGRADFPHPAFPEIFAGRMHDVNRLAFQRNHRLEGPRGRSRSCGSKAPCETTPRLRQYKSGRAPSLDRHYPASSLL